MNKRILLLSGGADVGKSALIKRLAMRVEEDRRQGFFTESVYDGQQRIGFTVNSFNGESFLVAKTGYTTGVKLGRYGVDLNLLNKAMDRSISEIKAESVCLIDELGKLECLSDYFCQCIEALLVTPAVAVISSPLRGAALLTRVVSHPDVLQMKVTENNIQQVERIAEEWLRKIV